MRRKSKYELPKSNTSFALNINSMTDMFTIMLVFLLQTYSASPFELKPQKDIKLPYSTVEKGPSEALDISLSAAELKIKNVNIANLKDGKFENGAIDAEDQELIKPLFEKLQVFAKEIEKSTDPTKKQGEVILQAERTLPYSTLKKVMYTASAAGFPKLKLATSISSN